MTREQSIPGLSSADYPVGERNSRQSPNAFTGMTPADVLLLPEALQPLASWLMRQPEDVTLTQVAAFLGQSDAVARQQLNSLVQRGFVQVIPSEEEPRYATRFGDRRSRKLPDVLWQSLAPGSPLAVIRNPSGEQSVVAGEPFELYVTISNQGSHSAVIDVLIDETSQPYQWCAAPHDRLALGSQQSGEVVFHFQVPPQALPGVYDYCLVVDAPEHYPEDTPIRHSQRVVVLPPVQEVVRVNDPTFAIQPATSSTKPALLQPGQMLEVLVLVQNTSDRVDRFRLTCPDLAENWLTVRYPEGLNTPGLVVESDGLDLNPGATGQIVLLIHPPADAAAGTYSPTIRLHSANNPELMLLDLVYLQIRPVYYLTLELRTLLGRVKHGAGQYEVRLMNEGNTDRDLILSLSSPDEDKLCSHEVLPDVWQLPPKRSGSSDLRIQPVKWWRRPLFGGGRLITFYVDVQDRENLPLTTDRLQGTLVWEARPVWQLLLFILATLGALGAIALLIWLWLFQTPAPAKILEFGSQDTTYQEAEGDFIRLNWQVRNPTQLQTLRLSSQSPDGAALGQPVVYDFSQGVPKELQPFCTVQRVLICNGVQTDARKAGGYIFELAVIPKDGNGEPVDTKKTGTITIQAQFPVILSFKVNNQEAESRYLIPINKKQPQKSVSLSWEVRGGKDLRVELLPSPGAVRTDSQGSGKVNYLLPKRPNSETLTLKVTNAAGQQVSRSVTIETFDPALPSPSPKPRIPTVPVTALPPPPPGSPLPVIPIPAAPTVLPAPNAGTQPSQPPAPAAPGSAAPANKPPSPNPNAPAPADPNTLSPSELPPQFD